MHPFSSPNDPIPPQPACDPESRCHEAEAIVPSDIDPTPLEYRPVPPSQHTYKMVDGVMCVFTDETQSEQVFQVRGAFKGAWKP